MKKLLMIIATVGAFATMAHAEAPSSVLRSTESVKSKQEETIPPGFTAFALLHPGWYLGVRSGDKTVEKLIFRRFSYEGNLRNIFVLSCSTNARKPTSVEIIPPTALETFLRKNATAKLQRSPITIESEGGRQLNFVGEFDKIAGFVDFRSEDEFYAFLKLTGDLGQLNYISFPRAQVKFGLSIGENLPEVFKENFGEVFERDSVEHLSWQDVFVRCGELREKRTARD